jgi:SpoVK/Ycf46/Vps4 family AAA+-type ATPase
MKNSKTGFIIKFSSMFKFKHVFSKFNSLEEAIVSEKPNVKWDDIAGLENAKAALKEVMIYKYKKIN